MGALALAAACSSSSSSPPPAGSDAGDAAQGVSPQQAAGDAASAFCARANACAPAVVTLSYGDVTACTSRLTALYLPVFGANGATLTAAQTEACAQALPSVSCADLLSHQTADACKPTGGTLTDGAACSADWQCKANHCKAPLGQVCGTCAARAQAGGPCGVVEDCDYGLTCANGSCAKFGASGDTCGATQPCRADLVCRSGKCAAPVGAGEACAQGDGCDDNHGIVCDVGTKKCVSLTFGGPNAACGAVSGGLEACSAGGFCKGLAAPAYQGTCQAAAADGAACDATKGPNCIAGAICVSGTCTPPDPAKCK